MKRAPKEVTKEGQEIQALTLRIPKEMHEGIRVLSFATGRSINDIATHALANYLADEGHRDAVQGFVKRAQQQYRVALDKLADL
jgi:NRPS condensation-like uncharacterized protein